MNREVPSFRSERRDGYSFLWSEIMNLLHWKLLIVQQKLLEAMEKEMESLEEKNLVELDQEC